jgi:hypothetical protein
MNGRKTSTCLLFMLLFTTSTVWAGSQSGGASPFEIEQITAFGKQLEQELAARGARVALVSRIGRAKGELPEGIRYTHVGYAVYSQITTDDGRQLPGYVFYNLYQGVEHPDRSYLASDFPAEFFAAVYELRAGVIIPKPKLQQRLFKLFTDGSYEKLHNPKYSVLANPYNQHFQNCTEYVLDILHAALYQTTDMAVIKANTREWYRAQPIKISPLKLMFASISMPDVSLRDQPEGSLPITSSFGSIATYMEQNQLSDEIFEIQSKPAL